MTASRRAVLTEAVARVLGGQGSGNFGHAGRPGEIGGSSDEGGDAHEKAASRVTVKGVDASTVREVISLRKEGHSAASIKTKYGDKLTEKQVNNILYNYRQKLKGGGAETPKVETPKVEEAQFHEIGSKDFSHGAISKSEEYALENYVEVSDAVATTLRSGAPLDDEQARNIPLIDSAIAKSTLSDNTVLYRTVPKSVGYSVGEIISDKSFLSTTNARSAVQPHITTILMEIQAPAGTNALEVNHYLRDNPFAEEKEVLLPRDTHFEIISRTPEKIVARIRGKRTLGGPGSGNYGHAGRPGEIGGSGEGGTPSITDILSGKKLSGPMGSNPGGLYAVGGGKFYVKQYHDASQGYGEHLANEFYKDVGVRSPRSTIDEVDGKTYYASEWIDSKGTLADVGLTPERADKILDGFVGDAFIANWDALGIDDRNVIIAGEDTIRIDSGGTFLHRAQGAPKPAALLPTVGEWKTLNDSKLNPNYSRVFRKAGIKDADALGERAVTQIDKILKLGDKGWDKYVDSKIPKAPAAYRAGVTKMLSSRAKWLDEKRTELKARHLGGAGSGNFGHEGRPGAVGGSGGGVSVGDAHKISDPKTETRPHGTPIVKSKYGQVEISHLNPAAPVRYLARAKNGQSNGTYSNVRDAMNALRKPANSDSFHSGYLSPDVEWKVLGGEGSGNFGHAGIPGEVGGSAPATGYSSSDKFSSDVQDIGTKAIEKVKVKGLQSEHVKAIVEMKQAKLTANQIKAHFAKVGLTDKQVANALYNYNVKLKQVKKELEGNVGEQFEVTKAAISSTPKAPAPDTSFAQTPASANLPSGKAALAEHYGYKWQEKTWGPNAGKYAWHQNGVQQSAPFDKSQKEEAASTMHYGVGPKAPPPPPPPPPAFAHVEKAAAAPGQWPIGDTVPRAAGSNYPSKMNDQGQNWSYKLTANETSAIKAYTGSSYVEINKHLRGDTVGYSNQTKLSNYAKNISKAIDKSPTPPPPELVWRGVSHEGAIKLKESVAAGDVITLKGFQSTSIDPHTAVSWGHGKVLFEIKPSKGAYVKVISQHSSEKEYLLPHGAKYVVRGVKTIPFRHIYSSTQIEHHTVIQLEMQ